VSNVYNFFLAVSCAVAVLVLVVAGVNYLLNGGDWGRLQKSKYILKSGLVGFVLVLLGWVVIQSVVRTIGYSNAGGWWQFQCGQRETQKPVSQPFYKYEYYKNLKVYSDVVSFLKSGDKTAKLTGPIDARSFASQLKSLKDGEKLHFLAPVRVDSSRAAEELYLPLLTVLNENGKIRLDSTGEYWNLIQSVFPQSSLANPNDNLSQLLNKYLGPSGAETGAESLINSSGNTLSPDDLNQLYQTVAGILAGSGDRSTENLAGLDLQNASLAQLISLAQNYSPGAGSTDQMIGSLTTQVLKLTNDVVVEKEDSNGGLSIADWRCVSSGGNWKNNQCVCLDQNVLGTDLMCHNLTGLTENCNNSGGEWKSGDSNSSRTPSCGVEGSSSDVLPVPEWQQNAERAGSEDVASTEFCSCKQNSCLDGDGKCLGVNSDQDGDKIPNGQDSCPATPAAEKSLVNKDKTSPFYGCSCAEIGSGAQVCPQDQCVGDNWVDYPDGAQACKNGKFIATSCEPVSKTYEQKCADGSLSGSGDGNGSDSGNAGGENQSPSVNGGNSPWAASNKNPFQSGANKSGSSTSGQRSPGNAKARGAQPPSSKAPGKQPVDDRSKPPSGIDKLPPGDGNPGGGPMGNGTPEAIKASLKRIAEKDYLRYEMIFEYVSRISNTGFQGGLSMGCSGTIWVSYSLWRDGMDEVVVHEATHNGHNCNTGWGWGSSAIAERIAVANEIGSLCRVEGHQNMEEFPEQKTGITYKGKEVRGWISRNTSYVSPPGHLGTAAFRGPIAYAFAYGNTTKGPYHYGEDGSGLVLGLTQGEEDVIKMIMEGNRKKIVNGQTRCWSKPPKDLPPVELCDKPNVPELQIR
jgi:hypothetical protein